MAEIEKRTVFMVNDAMFETEEDALQHRNECEARELARRFVANRHNLNAEEPVPKERGRVLNREANLCAEFEIWRRGQVLRPD